MSQGFIRLSRKFFQNAYWTQKRTFSLSEAWLDLIQMARFDAEPALIILNNGRELVIERGEIHASLRFLADRWGWSVDKTLRYINKHIEKQEIIRQTKQGESILTLCNYDYYNPLPNTDQYTDKYSHKDTDQYTDQTPTSTNNKKEKESKERKEEDRVSSDEDTLSENPSDSRTPEANPSANLPFSESHFSIEQVNYRDLVLFFNAETRGVLAKSGIR